MKKLVILIMLFLFTLSSSNISADSSKKIVLEETTYYETIYTDKGEKIKEITEKEYKEKTEKKLKKEKEQDELDQLVNLMMVPSEYFFDDLGDGGGGSVRTSYIFEIDSTTATPTMTDLNCIEGEYYYCQGEALRDETGAMTSLHLLIYFDPEEVSGMRAEATLTWDGAPNYSLTDYLSISYENTVISADDNSIEASQYVEFDEIERYWWGGVKERTSHDFYEEFNYDPASADFENDAQGVIFNVRKVYTDYTPGNVINGNRSFVPLLKDDGTMYMDVDVTSAVYKLEFDVDLMSNYEDYESLNKISFAADYRHVYYGVNINPKLSVRAYFTASTPYAAFLNLDLTIDKVEDGTRRITLDVYNYEH